MKASESPVIKSFETIEKIVCNRLSVDRGLLYRNTRKRQIVVARQIIMHIIKKNTKLSLSTIGFHCGNKDHATVIHACKTVNNLIDTNSAFRIQYLEIINKISNTKEFEIKDAMTVEGAKKEYSDKIFKFMDRYKNLLNKLRKKKSIDNPIINHIAEIPDEILKELYETRVIPFLKTRKMA